MTSEKMTAKVKDALFKLAGIVVTTALIGLTLAAVFGFAEHVGLLRVPGVTVNACTKVKP